MTLTPSDFQLLECYVAIWRVNISSRSHTSLVLSGFKAASQRATLCQHNISATFYCPCSASLCMRLLVNGGCHIIPLRPHSWPAKVIDVVLINARILHHSLSQVHLSTAAVNSGRTWITNELSSHPPSLPFSTAESMTQSTIAGHPRRWRSYTNLSENHPNIRSPISKIDSTE